MITTSYPRRATSIALALSLLAFGLWNRSARAAETQAAKAAQIAASVQSFYDQTADLTAQFSQAYVHKLYNRTDRSRGQVTFKKPGKMRWDYDLPNGKVIVAGGKSLQVFEPGQDGEPDQMLVQDMAGAQLPNAMAFLMGTGRLDEDFSFRLLDPDHKVYGDGAVLELRPKEPTPHYERIVFYVSGAEATRGLVRRLVIVDASGNRNRFDFSELKFNADVPDSRFRYEPPKGTRVVDL